MTHSLSRLLAGPVLAAALSTAWAAGATEPAEPAESASAGTDIRFDISRFEVTGNTLLPPQQVDQLMAPYAWQLARQRGMAGIDAARAGLRQLRGAPQRRMQAFRREMVVRVVHDVLTKVLYG